MKKRLLTVVAVLAVLVTGCHNAAPSVDNNVYVNGGINRGDPSQKKICLVFTAADRADGADMIISTLKDFNIKGGFFYTGQFYELFPDVVERLIADGHYVGSHSFGHLLYASWDDPASLLVTKEEFEADMLKSFEVMKPFGITMENAPYFIPPYEHYNAQIAEWAGEMGLQVINFTPGTGSNGDYTTPDMSNYMSNDYIMDRILKYEENEPNGLNGHFMLIHFGTHPDRTEKFYNRLPELITTLQERGYEFVGVEEMLGF